jgi:hypothetical protein
MSSTLIVAIYEMYTQSNPMGTLNRLQCPPTGSLSPTIQIRERETSSHIAHTAWTTVISTISAGTAMTTFKAASTTSTTRATPKWSRHIISIVTYHLFQVASHPLKQVKELLLLLVTQYVKRVNLWTLFHFPRAFFAGLGNTYQPCAGIIGVGITGNQACGFELTQHFPKRLRSNTQNVGEFALSYGTTHSQERKHPPLALECVGSVTTPTEWRFVGAEFCTPKQHPQVEDALTEGEVGTRISVVIKKAIHD